MAASSPREITDSILDPLLCIHQLVLLELESTGITWTQFNALCMVEEHGEITMSEIAALARYSNAAAITTIERLVMLGCVTRIRSQKGSPSCACFREQERSDTHSEDP